MLMIQPKFADNHYLNVYVYILNVISLIVCIIIFNFFAWNIMEFANLIKCINLHLFILFAVLDLADESEYIIIISEEIQSNSKFISDLTMLQKHWKIWWRCMNWLHILCMRSSNLIYLFTFLIFIPLWW